MDVCLAMKQRLQELDLDQRDLAVAANVTESYISQLLTRKKLPPASERTDIYAKIEQFLKLPAGKLSKLADHQRREELKKTLDEPPLPLLKEVRELILRKCARNKEKEIRVIFERQPFGELKRLVTQKLLEVAKKVAQEELQSERRLRLVAQLIDRSYEQMRVAILEFLDCDIFDISAESCSYFLDPLIQSWDIDLGTFAMNVVLNRRLAPIAALKFEFVAKEATRPSEEEPGFKRFLRDRALSGNATDKEIEFLRSLRFNGKRPTPLYYYRELQNLRDPLHFLSPVPHKQSITVGQREWSDVPARKYHKGRQIEKQLQLDGKKKAIERWTKEKASESKGERSR